MKNPKVVIASVTGGLFGLILLGQAFAGAAEPVRLIDPANAADSTISVSTAGTVLAQVLPYYHEDAPLWCAEDMACWIGSNGDGRTDEEILAVLPTDLDWSSFAYAPDTIPAVEDEFGVRHDECAVVIRETDSLVVCADGYEEVS